jgi:hypothetical protein
MIDDGLENRTRITRRHTGHSHIFAAAALVKGHHFFAAVPGEIHPLLSLVHEVLHCLVSVGAVPLKVRNPVVSSDPSPVRL